MLKYLSQLIILLAIISCSTGNQSNEEAKSEEVNVYTHRHYEVDQLLFKRFTELTGIEVNVINASADELIQKLEVEGESTPADVLITVDAGRLHRAKEKDLLSSVNSDLLNQNIPANFRDPERYWFGLTYRARVIAYSKDRVTADQLTTYEDLANSKWKGKVLARSSGNIYNQSLLASIIVANVLVDQRAIGSAELAVRAGIVNVPRELLGDHTDNETILLVGNLSLDVRPDGKREREQKHHLEGGDQNLDQFGGLRLDGHGVRLLARLFPKLNQAVDEENSPTDKEDSHEPVDHVDHAVHPGPVDRAERGGDEPRTHWRRS